MTHVILTYLPWLISIVTVYAMWLAGEKKPYAWSISLVNQALWLVYIVTAHAWGLLPMNIVLWFVFGRNYLRWRDSAKILGHI